MLVVESNGNHKQMDIYFYHYFVDVDYSLPAQSLSVTFSSVGGEQFCIDVSTIQDTLGEGTEQFELYFENLPSAFARDGDPNVLCINIGDDDGELISVNHMQNGEYILYMQYAHIVI